VEVGDKVMLEVSSWKDVVHFGKKEMLAPRYYLADTNLHVHLKEIKVDKTLRFAEEPVEIIDREEVIVNGDAPAIALASAGTEGPIPPKTAEQKLARKNELKAKSTLLTSPLVDDDMIEEHVVQNHDRTQNPNCDLEEVLPMVENIKEIRDHLIDQVIGELYQRTLRLQEHLMIYHLEAVKRIFRYLKGTQHSRLWYPKDTRKKTSLANFITEFDNVATERACQQALWIKQAFVGYNIILSEVPILCDGKCTINLTSSPIDKCTINDQFNYLRLGLGLMLQEKEEEEEQGQDVIEENMSTSEESVNEGEMGESSKELKRKFETMKRYECDERNATHMMNALKEARMKSRGMLLSFHHSIKMVLDIISKMNKNLEDEKIKMNDKGKEKVSDF
ncbi:hypothetical protein Tco_0649666, partial [Tanacetum coccineum]